MEELECRICRANGEPPNEKLCSPCLCSGSIALVHQACLEEWLAHSKKESCELCSTKYKFAPQYAIDAPSEVPLNLLIGKLVSKFFFEALPFVFRVIAAGGIWGAFIPMFTTMLFRMWIRLEDIQLWTLFKTKDIVPGIALTVLILLSFVILMSFADFMRVHGVPGAGVENQLENARLQQLERQQQQLQNPPQQQQQQQQPVAAADNVHRRWVALRRERRRIAEDIRHDMRDDEVLLRLQRHRVDNLQRRRAQTPVNNRPQPNGTAATATTAAVALVPPLDEVPVEDGPLDLSPNNWMEDSRTVSPREEEAHQLPLSHRTSDDVDDGIDEHIPNSNTTMNTNRTTGTVKPEEAMRGALQLMLESDSDDDSDYNTDDGTDDGTDDDDDDDDIDEDSEEEDDDVNLVNNNNNNNNNFNGLPQDVERQVRAVLNEAEVEAPLFGDDVDVDDDMMGAQPIDGEINFPLGELLGLNSFSSLLRNALFLVLFNLFYVGIVVYLPVLVSKYLHKIILNSFVEFRLQAMLWLRACMPETSKLFQGLVQASAAAELPLQFLDLYYYSTGISLIATSVISTYYSCRLVNHFNRSFQQFFDTVAYVSSVAKIGSLLLLRVFFLPVILGAVFLSCINVLLQVPTPSWIEFGAINLIGLGALCWVLGISYMVTTTLAILQLREILHPKFLAKTIRPQEPHLELLVSLLQDTGITHFRRICISMLVYVSILAVTVYVPLLASRMLLDWVYFPTASSSLPTLALLGKQFLSHLGSLFSTSASSVDSLTTTSDKLSILSSDLASFFFELLHYNGEQVPLNFCYYSTQLQVPAELVLIHLSFLTMLERKKSSIGRLQFQWLAYITSVLGMSRFVLPFVKRLDEGAEDVTDEQFRYNHPIRRPPVHWDSRTRKDTNRWAWGAEALPPIEQALAERVIPSHWMIRSIVLIVLTWLLVASIVLVVAFVPVSLGRAFMRLLQIPEWMYHDPLCFILGLLMIAGSVGFLASPQRRNLLTQYWNAVHKLPLSIVLNTVKLTICWMTSELVVGWLIHVEMAGSDLKVGRDMLSAWFLLGTYLKGSAVLGILLALVYSGHCEKFLRILYVDANPTEQQQPARPVVAVAPAAAPAGNNGPRENRLHDALVVIESDQLPEILPQHKRYRDLIIWTRVIRTTLSQPSRAFLQNDWSDEQVRLRVLWDRLVWPLFLGLGILAPLLITGCAYGLRTLPQYVNGDAASYINASRVCCLTFALFGLVPVISVVADSWFRGMSVSIKNEYYLIGKVLLDAKDTM